MQFQAKDIQRLVEIQKFRYDYLFLKIGIKPEIEEVQKTGHTHLYSFKNLLEFAIVNTANNLGIGPKAVKEILNFLTTNNDLKDAGLFNPEKEIKASLHYADSKDGKFFKLSGSSISDEDKKGVWIGKGFDKVREVLKKMSNNEGDIDISGFVEEQKNLKEISAMKLDDFDGYITINLGRIKDMILKKIK